MSALERMCFLVEWFDVHAQLTRQYQLFYYDSDNSIEMYDPKQKRTFLKRTKTEELKLQDFHVGAAVNVALVIIKPDAINNAGEILDTLISQGFVICKLRMLKLSRKLAEEVCMVSSGAQPYFNDLVSSLEGPRAMALELMKSSAVSELTRITGPAIVADAKSSNPTSLRARFGHAGYKNGIYISNDPASAKKEVALLFDNQVKRDARTAVFKKSTLAIIKPHAIHAGLTGKIIASITQNGYTISDAETFYLDRVNAEEFLEVYKTVVPEYQKMVDELTSGPLVALEITGPHEDIVAQFREFVGPSDPGLGKKLRPKSLRALYGQDKVKNAVHCTDLEEDGILEVQFFFRIMANMV
ncbi:nucleoside diphosphate kinase [Obelidium mucronatum]|nr:nucleoside diphosphate kinase [Obelidium mucronatum]